MASRASASSSERVGGGLAQPTSYESIAGSGSMELDGGSCRYYAPESPGACAYPRSCSDCVRRRGCMITTDGTCDDLDTYDPYLDYHYALEVLELALPNALDGTAVDAINATYVDALNEKLSFVFPARVTKYCAADDAVCTRCRTENFWTINAADSRFCVGANGCVCVFNCELPVNSPRLDCPSDDYYSSWVPSPSPTASTSTRLAITLVPAAIGAAFILAAAVYMHILKRRTLASRANPSVPPTATPVRQQPTSQPQAPVAGSAPVDDSVVNANGVGLELYGWQSHRQGLIDDERRRLNGDHDLHPPLATAYAQYESR